ncbi:hypothetical protein D5086_008819 [Populus alba]|uniref:Uncharacterized protein n=1 Tax=Populus alba TaxID=43335 RepID=A0ACC4CGY4_POPAL
MTPASPSSSIQISTALVIVRRVVGILSSLADWCYRVKWSMDKSSIHFQKCCLFMASLGICNESFGLRSNIETEFVMIDSAPSRSMSSRTNSELVAASIAFMKESLCIVDESFKDEVLSIFKVCHNT